MKVTLFIIATVLCLSGEGQIKASNLNYWNSYSLPLDSLTLEQYSFSNCEWRVFESSNSVFAAEVERNPTLKNIPFKLSPSNLTEEVFFQRPTDVIKVDDGYLISFNRGEFGGYLYWFSSDGIHNKKIALSRISKFITRENNIYAIDGIGHGINMGSIVELKKQDRDWIIEQYLKLPSDPRAITLDTNKNF